MQLKYLQTILENQNVEAKIVSLAWSPNNQKLAVATLDRQILLYDAKGERRDRFSTKPADSEASKKSYVITAIAFSPDSTKLAVAQSDCIVYVYKLGEKWGEKKAICNKFPQPSPVTCAIWLGTGPLICGLSDGKVRSLQTKSNKSHSLYASDSLVVSLCPNTDATGFLSGHVDGNIVRFYTTPPAGGDAPGRIILHPVPPVALAWPLGHVLVAGCDRRVAIYGAGGRLVRAFDLPAAARGLTAAACSPGGQAVAVGGFGCVRLYAFSTRRAAWEEAGARPVPHLYAVGALAWRRDGAAVACGNLTGSVLLFESVLRRTIWRDKYEITYVGASQILVRSLDGGGAGGDVTVRSSNDIDDVKVMGHDSYLVARTATSLILVDLLNNQQSEINWQMNANGEKFYFDYATVCLIFNAGELTLVEYGFGELCSVRTEFANPHLISVRLNERGTCNNKKLAYLIDLKTVCVVDLQSGQQVAQVAHDSKIDWLELSETGNKLLFRDKKRRLLLFDLCTQVRVSILSGVGFVQWVEGSDVAVGQTSDSLVVWYNINLPESPTVMAVSGEVVAVERSGGRTEAVLGDGGRVALDEGLVEFGTAIGDNDFSRAVLYLESIDGGVEADAMWHHLLAIGRKEHNLKLIERCYAALGDVSACFYVKDTLKCDSGERLARLAILNGDLRTAEGIYLESSELERALEMYKRLHKWPDAVRLAAERGYPKLAELKDEQMRRLVESGQFERVGQVLEADGKAEEALNMYLKANKLVRIPSLLLKNERLLNDQELTSAILKRLAKQEMYEACAEIYEKLSKEDLALECYRKGKVYNKSVDLARRFNPERVTALEEEWGHHLVAIKQYDAAISHYIEAGATLKALQTSIAAKQWKKAVHIVRVIDTDAPNALEYHQQIAEHFAKAGDYKTAEGLYVSVGMHRQAIEMYIEGGQWEQAHLLAVQRLSEDEVAAIFVKRAHELEALGRFRDAERLYVSTASADMAIAMYKRTEQYDHMIRLVEKHHPDLLHATHAHLGQQLEAEGRYRAAEAHYLAASEWKPAMGMYRTLGMWEEAYRVAKQNGGAGAATQVAYLWARQLPIDSAIRLLGKHAILEQCVALACDNQQFEFAFQLCKNQAGRAQQVHYKYAMALEDDGRFGEAEAEFIDAGRPKEAILMHVHAKQWMRALRLAEQHEPEAVGEVLEAQAADAFGLKQFAEFESLLLRAQMPDLIVKRYKAEAMWIDALRVCKDYLPLVYPTLQAEYAASGSRQQVGPGGSIEALLSRANEWALAGQHRQAVECLLQVTTGITDASVVRRALLRAADMVNKFLFGEEAAGAVRALAPRLVREVGEVGLAAQLYASVDLVREAVDVFIAAEEWPKARKLAREVEPALEAYVEGRHRERLVKKGDVEQLADVDLVGALDLLAEQGQWVRCIEKAVVAGGGGGVLHKYVALYAAKLLKDGFVCEALGLYVAHGAPATPQNYNIYNAIATEMFALRDVTFALWEQLRRVLLEVSGGLEGATMETRQHFANLLLIAHYYAVRAACRPVASLKSIVVKLSTALLRYTDIIPADKAYFEAGRDMREEGRLSEAFVFLNHYLDLCEAIEEGEGELVDHSDLVRSDFPSSIPLPGRLFLAEDQLEHDGVREWVLTISMDQRVEQSLPIDEERQLFESSLQPGEQACIVSGYPLGKATVQFDKTSQRANKDVWAKLNMGAKMAPESNVSSVLTFMRKWCGNANT